MIRRTSFLLAISELSFATTMTAATPGFSNHPIARAESAVNTLGSQNNHFNQKEFYTMSMFDRNKQTQDEVPALNPKLAAFSAGFAAYMAGAAVDTMPTQDHRNGWWSALDAEVEATMPQRNGH
jgi:hypothetical protein